MSRHLPDQGLHGPLSTPLHLDLNLVATHAAHLGSRTRLRSSNPHITNLYGPTTHFDQTATHQLKIDPWMESLTTLANSLPTGNLANAEKDLLNSFKGASLITLGSPIHSG